MSLQRAPVTAGAQPRHFAHRKLRNANIRKSRERTQYRQRKGIDAVGFDPETAGQRDTQRQHHNSVHDLDREARKAPLCQAPDVRGGIQMATQSINGSGR